MDNIPTNHTERARSLLDAVGGVTPEARQALIELVDTALTDAWWSGYRAGQARADEQWIGTLGGVAERDAKKPKGGR